MDDTCYKCGTVIDSCTAFCPSCGAPQIRVQATAESSPSFPSGVPEDVQPPAEPVPLTRPTAETFNWREALPGALLAGVVVGFSYLIPFSTYFLFILAGGALGVGFYRRKHPQVLIRWQDGAKVGAVSGVVSFGVFAVILSLQMLVTRNSGQFRAMMEQAIRQAASRSDAAGQEMMQKLLTPEGLAMMVVLVMAVFFFVFVLLSAAGGAIGAALFGGSPKK